MKKKVLLIHDDSVYFSRGKDYEANRYIISGVAYFFLKQSKILENIILILETNQLQLFFLKDNTSPATQRAVLNINLKISMKHIEKNGYSRTNYLLIENY